MSIGTPELNERKKLIFTIYNMFGKLSEHKIRNIIFSNESPLQFIFNIPQVLCMYIVYSIGVPKKQTRKWFEDNYMENI